MHAAAVAVVTFEFPPKTEVVGNDLTGAVSSKSGCYKGFKQHFRRKTVARKSCFWDMKFLAQNAPKFLPQSMIH